MLVYANVDIAWLNDFITLDRYETQTQWVEDLLHEKGDFTTNENILLTLAKSATYYRPWDQLEKVLPPLAEWWLDPRSKPYRQKVIDYLNVNNSLNQETAQLRFVHDLTISPSETRNNWGALVVNVDDSWHREHALSAHGVAITVNTWFPELAPTLLHCLSPLWNLTRNDFQRTDQPVDVYADLFNFFKKDIVAQRMLVYLGHQPGENESDELHALYRDFEDDEKQSPWTMYEELGLDQHAIMQAEYAREHGISNLSINALNLDHDELTP